MPLNELASSRRIAGVNSVLRKLKADGVSKIFISKEADIPLKAEILTAGKKVFISTVMDVRKFVFRKKKLPDFRRNLQLKEM